MVGAAGIEQRPLRCQRSALPLSYAPILAGKREEVPAGVGAGEARAMRKRLLSLLGPFGKGFRQAVCSTVRPKSMPIFQRMLVESHRRGEGPYGRPESAIPHPASRGKDRLPLRRRNRRDLSSRSVRAWDDSGGGLP